MTRRDAISTGQNAAIRFGKAFVVYRLPAWKPDVYGCIGADRELPADAETFERLEPDGNERPRQGQASLF